MPVKEHYENHLANFYSWMTGDLDQRQREHQQIFKDLEISPSTGSLAIDLGSGHGIQSIALAELGFEVQAVDFNRQLLDELAVNKKSRKIQLHHQDIFSFLETSANNADVIVCMGDTITHFPSYQQLENLFRLTKKSLTRGGSVVVSFRNLHNELSGTSRFIPVKSDEQRLLTCFLEYFDDHVMVHDLLWENTNDGWKQTVSAYPKLRLSEEMVVNSMMQNGLGIRKSFVRNGMIFVCAYSLTH